MPSTVVHVGVAALLAAALLGDAFDARAVLIVFAVVAFPDLDTLLGIYVPGTHRAAFHTLFVVLVPAALLWWDGRRGEASWVRTRWGASGHRVAWVSLVALLFAHLLLDAFFNGINLLWPVYDRFFDLSGQLLVTDQRGLVQTFVEFDFGPDGGRTVADSTARGTTENTHYTTGFDPTRDDPPEDVERIFPIAATGERFVLAVTGYLTVAYRVVEERR